ncbi:hypothetical protein A0H81_04086 [Grifola frondosa]|uniref:Uncharacterized protein n=1 Tax=Grifola frondosa TaxID=5627 RepID=A0A1C7MHC6_GRIFR|nr:hypothetical protein A0H81_04086 [Grifola frondosa]
MEHNSVARVHTNPSGFYAVDCPNTWKRPPLASLFRGKFCSSSCAERSPDDKGYRRPLSRTSEAPSGPFKSSQEEAEWCRL